MYMYVYVCSLTQAGPSRRPFRPSRPFPPAHRGSLTLPRKMFDVFLHRGEFSFASLEMVKF